MASLLATDLLLPALLLASGKEPAAHHALSSPTITEHAEGWHIALAAPGMQPKDVEVAIVKNREGSASIRLQSTDFRHALRLPPKADCAGVKASLVHGLLRVHVPRLPTRLFDVPVAAEAPEASKTEGEGAAAQPEEATVTLAVPGVAPEEVKVKVEDDHLVVSAHSAHGFGSYMERYKLPERALVEKVAATCQHGIISVRVPIAPEPVHTITISDDLKLLAPAEEAAAKGDKRADASKGRHDLLQVAVPGFSAADFSADVRGRVLQVNGARESEGARVVIRRSVALPAGTPPEAVKVVCANGVLGAWLLRDALGAPFTETPVPVAAEPISLPPAAAAKNPAIEGAAATTSA